MKKNTSKTKAPSIGKRKTVKIESKEAYELTLEQINVLMKKGEKNLQSEELKTLRALAEAAEFYEDKLQP